MTRTSQESHTHIPDAWPQVGSSVVVASPTRGDGARQLWMDEPQHRPCHIRSGSFCRFSDGKRSVIRLVFVPQHSQSAGPTAVRFIFVLLCESAFELDRRSLAPQGAPRTGHVSWTQWTREVLAAVRPQQSECHSMDVSACVRQSA